MAERYWIASVAGNWNDTNNWSTSSGGGSGASVPVSGDNANFDGNGTGGCTLDRNETCTNLTFNTGFGSTLDMGGFNLTVEGDFDGGTDNLTLIAVTFTVGSGTLDLQGNISPARMSWAASSGLVTISGTSKTFQTYFNGGKIAVDVTVSGSLTLLATTGAWDFAPAEGAVYVFTVSGTLTSGNSSSGVNVYQGDVKVTSTGTVTQTGTGNRFTVRGHSGTNFEIESGGSWDVETTFSSYRLRLVGTTTFERAVIFSNWTTADEYTLDTGATYTFKDDVTFNSSFANAKLNANGASKTVNYVFQGDITDNSTQQTVKGLGTITFSGAENQSIDLNKRHVEDIVLNKSAGTVTFAEDCTTDSLTGTDGELDINGNRITVIGAFSYPGTNATTIKDTAATGLLDCNDSFDIDNVTWTDADISVSDPTPTATNCTISGSTATGSDIDATSGCTDSGSNSGWLFGGEVGATATTRIFRISRWKYPSLWDGCMGAYCASFTGPTGDRLRDCSNYKQHGTLTNMTLSSDWAINGGKWSTLHDSTYPNHINLGAMKHLAAVDRFTVTFWVKPNSLSGSYLGKWSSDNDPVTDKKILLRYVATGRIQFYLRNSADTAENAGSSSPSNKLTTSAWHFVHAEADGSNLRISVDDSGFGADTALTGPYIPSSSGNISIGRAQGSNLDGYIDDVRFYNRLLTADEKQLLYLGGRGVAYKKRIQYFGGVEEAAAGTTMPIFAYHYAQMRS